MRKDARMKPPVNWLIDAKKNMANLLSAKPISRHKSKYTYIHIPTLARLATGHSFPHQNPIKMHADSGHCFLRSIVQQLPIVSRHWTDWKWDS